MPADRIARLALHCSPAIREHGIALLEESAELAKKIRWRWWRAGTLGVLAETALVDKEVTHARVLLRESIDLALQVLRSRGDSRGYLGSTHSPSQPEGDAEPAGWIWGAVEAASAFIPGGPWPRRRRAPPPQDRASGRRGVQRGARASAGRCVGRSRDRGRVGIETCASGRWSEAKTCLGVPAATEVKCRGQQQSG